VASNAHLTVDEPVREGDYGEKVIAVEPGGVEYIPPAERHGRPIHLFWTWTSPNLEFATVFLGVLAIAAFGLSLTQALLAILLGNVLGSLSHAVLSARGPEYGVPQMVLSRLGFGYWGNILPAGLMSVTAGIGWFAVNSVSGAFALASLTGLSAKLCLLVIVAIQIAVAFFGHNLVHVFERYALPFLAVVFGVAAVVILAKSHPGAAPNPKGYGGIGGFLVATAAVFGYAAGWNPYAADYTRYLPADVDRRRTGLFAGLGVFVSCTVLELVGAASVTIGAPTSQNPTEAFVGYLPGLLANLTLLAIALGAIAANVLNIYSGAMAFLAMGVRLPLALRRAIVALVFGAVGLVAAWYGLQDAGQKYEQFLLVISYWIAPWLAVMFTDQLLRRGRRSDALLYSKAYANWAGVLAMIVGMVVSIWLFSNQVRYVGLVPKAHPAVGDLTFVVGFVLTAGLYAVLHRVLSVDRGSEVQPAVRAR